ncbi:XrtA system polysaccharide chain length determinant [Sphingomonas crocodyli]|uniref:Polysaccharide chain length determinant n=1 Tax=Sphingomonas crocodyli TaxID=1979270 RepID=A0A437M8B4_9SPHN|nr:XrtA system polysaccharide chain length determinant [Sphingomonas crocodyli]RVT93775.1 polysaccharide chain length determinant [Sphingomonas crocodyli]
MEAIYTEIRIALFAIWRLRWLAIVVAWGVCLVGWAFVMRIPAAFESSTRISVQTSSRLTGQIGIDDSDRQKDMERVRQSLTSTETLKRVVANVSNGERALTSAESLPLIGALRSGISITANGDNLLEIKTRVGLKDFSDRETAFIVRNVTQQLVDIFVQENILGSRDESQQALAFLDQELARRAKELANVDRQRAALAQRTMGNLPGSGSLEQRMELARNELSNVESNLMSAQSALAAMNGQLAATPASIPVAGAPGGGSTEQRIALLEGQLSDATARGWTDRHPDVIAMKSQLAQARAEQRRGGSVSGPMAPNPVYVSIKSMQAERQGNVAMYSARKAQLQADMQQIATRQLTAPDEEATGQKLDRDYTVLRDQYNKLLADRETAKLRADATGKSDKVAFRVIDRPSFPTKPAAPNRPLLLTGVLIAGLVVGAGVAFAKSQLSNSYTTTQQLAKASGLPVLGAISEVVTVETRAAKRQQLIWFSSAAGALTGVFGLLLLVEFVKRLMIS